MSKTRNSEVLASFVKYCEENPELRFWQALKNWSGYRRIIAVVKDITYSTEGYDTYNWEGKNHEDY